MSRDRRKRLIALEKGTLADALLELAQLLVQVGSAPDAGWLRMHWRPLVTMTVIGGVIAGVTFSYEPLSVRLLPQPGDSPTYSYDVALSPVSFPAASNNPN